jgi:hypothetical protein
LDLRIDDPFIDYFDGDPTKFNFSEIMPSWSTFIITYEESIVIYFIFYVSYTEFEGLFDEILDFCLSFFFCFLSSYNLFG